MSRTLIPSLVGAICALWVGTAAAAPTVAPLVPSFRPAKDAEIVTRFQDAVAKGLAEGGVKVVPPATVRSRVKRPCAKTACAIRALRRLLATQVAMCVIATVGKTYTIKLTMASKSGAGDKVSGRCDICTLMEALSSTQRLAKKLAEKLGASPSAAPAKPPKKYPIATKPPPRKSLITTKLPGKTPSKSAKAEKPGTPSPKASEGRPWPLWPALAAAGAGVLGLAVGIPLLSIDGDATNCRGNPRPDNRNCQDVFSTSGAGWVMTTMGLAGLATSGVLFYLYFTARNSPRRAGGGEAGKSSKTSHKTAALLQRLSIAPTRNGFYLGASGTF